MSAYVYNEVKKFLQTKNMFMEKRFPQESYNN